jgi:multiple sugar transport system permease protein
MSNDGFAYRSRTERRLLMALVVVLTIMLMLPFLWLLLMSFKTNDEVFAFPPRLFFTPTLDNYRGLWNSSFPKSFTNSAVVSIASTVLALLVGVPGAYALSRKSRSH